MDQNAWERILSSATATELALAQRQAEFERPGWDGLDVVGRCLQLATARARLTVRPHTFFDKHVPVDPDASLPTVVVHIRKRAGRGLGRAGYSHAHVAMFRPDYVSPDSQTLCGEPATTDDLSWADTRYPPGQAHVTCQPCLARRLA